MGRLRVRLNENIGIDLGRENATATIKCDQKWQRRRIPASVSANSYGDFPPACTVHGIVRADNDQRRARRKPDARKGARKGLFLLVGMGEDADRENIPVRRQDFPAIRIVVPAFVRVGDGDVEPADSLFVTTGIDGDDISLAGRRSGGQHKDRQYRQKPAERAGFVAGRRARGQIPSRTSVSIISLITRSATG